MGNLTCKCKQVVQVESTSNAGSVISQTGWTPFFNQRNGLEMLWLCPACTERVKQASHLLREVFGEELSYIHMAKIAKLSE